MEERTCSVYSSAGSESGMHLAEMKADHSIESSAHKVPFDLGVVQAMISHRPVAKANRNVDSPGALDFLWIFSGRIDTSQLQTSLALDLGRCRDYCGTFPTMIKTRIPLLIIIR